MAISWRRGFFRIWVLLAVLWTIGSVCITIGIYNGASAGIYAFIETKGDVAFRYGSREYSLAEEAKSRKLMEEVNFKESPNITVFALPNSDAHDIGPVIEHFVPLVHGFYQMKLDETRLWIILYSAIWTIGMPLLVLALGSAIAWALSGFAGRPRDQVGA